MHPDVRHAASEGARTALSVLSRTSDLGKDLEVVWTRSGENQWSSEIRERPNLIQAFTNQFVNWDQLGAPLTDAIRVNHPDHTGLVGTSIGQGTFNGSELLRRIVAEIWRRCSSWVPAPEVVEAVIDEFGRFISTDTIPAKYFALLHNLYIPAPDAVIRLPQGIVIRRVSDREFSEIYGFSSLMQMTSFGTRPLGVHEWAICGEYTERKVLQGMELAPHSYDAIRQNLDRAMLALRTYKAGRIGYDTVRLSPQAFSPVLFGTEFSALQNVPLGGIYQLEPAEIERLEAHARSIFSPLHGSLEVGCSRLADAEIRLNVRDAILDAVIGLEAILLATTGKEEYRGEMRYRFAMNYASLEPDPAKRLEAFRSARTAYDLRSTIAHGGTVREPIKLSGREQSVPEAADEVKGMLRALINQFLPHGRSPVYLAAQFWDRSILGVADGANEE